MPDDRKQIKNEKLEMRLEKNICRQKEDNR